MPVKASCLSLHKILVEKMGYIDFVDKGGVGNHNEEMKVM